MTSEKCVVNKLKQLTEALFIEHYQKNENKEQKNVLNVTPETTTAAVNNMKILSNVNVTQASNSDETNNDFSDFSIENGAEQFCAIIIKQLTVDDHIESVEKWHNEQLNAYDFAYKCLFKKLLKKK